MRRMRWYLTILVWLGLNPEWRDRVLQLRFPQGWADGEEKAAIKRLRTYRP